MKHMVGGMGASKGVLSRLWSREGPWLYGSAGREPGRRGRHWMAMGWGMVVLASLMAPSAWACTCIAPPPPQEALEASDAVFLGRVVQVRRDASDINEGHLFATIEVERTWKGGIGQRVTVQTAPNSAMCGFYFQEGERYIVYAAEQEGALTTNICTRSKAAQQAEEDLAALGTGEPPEEARIRRRCGGPTNAAALQAGLFLLGTAFFLRRRVGKSYPSRRS